MKIPIPRFNKSFIRKPSKALPKSFFNLVKEHQVNGDIFDMELTPNRGDCLSVLGLARDLKFF